MRITFAFCLALLTLAGPARAQTTAQFYIGAWREIPIERAPARRLVLHHIEIAQIPDLRAPRRFNVRIWLRCDERPNDACEFGAATGVERRLGDNSLAIYVEMNPRTREPLRPCRFNLLLVPAYLPDDPANPESSKTGIAYRITPPGGPCAASEYSGITDTLGTLERMAVLNQRVEPSRPALPRPRF